MILLDLTAGQKRSVMVALFQLHHFDSYYSPEVGAFMVELL